MTAWGFLALEHATHILLRGVPKTATPNDVWRAVQAADVVGVKAIRKVYDKYQPTRLAVLQMAVPDYTRDAVHKLENLSIGSSAVQAQATVDEEYLMPDQRRRGHAGRTAAVRRGINKGDGQSAGGWPSKSTVTLTGTPLRATLKHIQELTEGFEMLNPDFDDCAVKCPQRPLDRTKANMNLYGHTTHSRWILSFKDEVEAERFVRKYDQMPFMNGTLVADIIY